MYILSYPEIADEEEIIAYYKLQRKAYRYARDFFYLIGVSSNIYGSLLPVVFRDNLASIYKSVESGERGYAAGNFASGNGWLSNEKQAVIFIDLPRQKKAVLSPGLKQYIRHEIIHYYLWLMDLPYDDDCALFWAYCDIFDGKAYQEMPHEEQEKYNRYISKRSEYPDASTTSLKLLAGCCNNG